MAAFTASFTAKRGQTGIEDIAIGAGSAEAQHDTISLNIDIDTMSKGETLLLIEKLRDAVAAAEFPPA